MPSGNIADPHIIHAILAIAGAAATLLGLICVNMTGSGRREGRKG